MKWKNRQLKFCMPINKLLNKLRKPYLPAVGPTNGGKMGHAFSHDQGNHCTNTDLLIWLWFIYCTMVSPFILHCFSFCENVKQKDEKLLEVSVIYSSLYFLFHVNGQYMWTWLHYLLKLPHGNAFSKNSMHCNTILIVLYSIILIRILWDTVSAYKRFL